MATPSCSPGLPGTCRGNVCCGRWSSAARARPDCVPGAPWLSGSGWWNAGHLSGQASTRWQIRPGRRPPCRPYGAGRLAACPPARRRRLIRARSVPTDLELVFPCSYCIGVELSTAYLNPPARSESCDRRLPGSRPRMRQPADTGYRQGHHRLAADQRADRGCCQPSDGCAARSRRCALDVPREGSVAALPGSGSGRDSREEHVCRVRRGAYCCAEERHEGRPGAGQTFVVAEEVAAGHRGLFNVE
jgi:hypothetical protein